MKKLYTYFLIFTVIMFLGIIGCNLGGSDDDESEIIPVKSFSGKVEFPESAGTKASIKAKVDFTKYRVYINGVKVTLNDDGTFNGDVLEADEYVIEVRFAGSPKAILKATANKGEESGEIGVNVQTTAHTLAYEAFKEQAGKSDTNFKSFEELVEEADEAIQSIAESIETALQSLSNIESEDFDLEEDEGVKSSTEEAVQKAEKAEENQATTSTSTSTTTTTAATGTSTTTSTAAVASAPTGILAINEGAAFTTTRDVTLNLSGVTGEGVLTMSVDSGDFEPLNQAKSYTLSEGDGTKTVNIILKDGSGQQSETISDSITLDTTPFAVSSTVPASGSTDLKVSTTITTTLVRAPDQSTVSASSFSVTDPYGNAVAGAFSFSGNSIIFTPTFYLVNGSYTVSLTNSIKDAVGNGLANHSFQFAVLGTIMVKDIYPGVGEGPYSSYPTRLTDVNGTLFFSAQDSTNGYELWKSDGTAAGTVLVKDVRAGSGNSSPLKLTDVNGTLFFTADDGSNGYELWKSDGTEAGTVMVKDVDPRTGDGAYSSNPNYLTNVNGTLFFTATTASGTELWKSDGTEGGTVMVMDIATGTSSSNPKYLTDVNGTLFFQAITPLGIELGKSDGTEEGTVLVKDIDPRSGEGGPYSSNPNYLTNVNGTLFFAASTVSGTELWKSDGTSDGTVMVMDINSGSGSSSPQYLYNHNGTLFFSANDGINGREPWKSDGTTATMIRDIDVGGSSYPSYFTGLNNIVVFSATCNGGGEPHRSDGTEAGTYRIRDIYEGSSESYAEGYATLNNTVYFKARDLQDSTQHGTELWQSDGTTQEGTVLVHDIYSGTGSSSPSYLTVSNGILFFQARNQNDSGYELWRINN
ncbi:ELWxxDGT repeat protein [Candidatus Riflebacteria bacterium]